MLLLTWHGTLVCLRQNGGGLVHLPIGVKEADTAPLDLDIGREPPEAPRRIQSMLGPLTVSSVAGRRVSVARYGQMLSAPPDLPELSFDREQADIWESFLPVTATGVEDLAGLLGGMWIDRATRRVFRRGAVRLLEGFIVQVDGIDIDLQTSWPARIGQEGAAATGYTVSLGGTDTELVLAEPRSSALLNTIPWPPRARRVAEIMALAAHRQISGYEPAQDVFERDVADLLECNGPPGLSALLERLLDETRPEPIPQRDDADETDIDAVLQSWALSQTAPFAPGSVDPDAARATYEELNETTPWAFIFRIRNGLVSMDDKPEGVAPPAIQAERAEAYLRFLQSVAMRLPPDLSTILCVSVDDLVSDIGEFPVFGFQKGLGERPLLLPDVDLLDHAFFESGELDDTTAYMDKSPSAVFAGSTSGGIITPDVARALSLPRLRAAAFFDSHERVDFRLPNIVQCEAGAADILRAQPFCQKPTLTWEEQMRNRMLISMDGNGATCARVAVALRSNCVLLKYDSPDSLYYFAGMQPWLHYVPVSKDEDVEIILSQEANLPAAFARIAEEGRRFAQTYLSRDSAERYTALLLERYAAIFGVAEATPTTMLRRASGQQTLILAHLEATGDVDVPAGAWAGEPGSGLAIEGLGIFFEPDLPRQSLSYQVVLEGGALSQAAKDGEFLGTRGRAKPLYGVRIFAEDDADSEVEIAYEAYFTDGTQSGPCAGGDVCSSSSGAPIEALLVRIKSLSPRDRTGDARQAVIDATGNFNDTVLTHVPAAGLKDVANAALDEYRTTAGLQESFRFAFHRRPEDGPNAEAVVVAIDAGDAGTTLYIDSAQTDPGQLMLRATALIYVMEAMLAWAPLDSCQFVAELGDTGLRDGSVSFCSANPKTFLLPDFEFIASAGHDAERHMISGLGLAWHDRRPVVFWRGATTGDRRHAPPAHGEPDDFTWLPRLEMCQRARLSPHSAYYDVGISNLAQLDDPELHARIEEAGLRRPPADRTAFASCKAILVIDGNSNAWSALFCALLSGACVLRVESEHGFRQWYYDDLKPWVNYVPIRADLADMDDAVAWVMANDDAARQIGEAGRALADAMTFESVVADAARRLRAWVEK